MPIVDATVNYTRAGGPLIPRYIAINFTHITANSGELFQFSTMFRYIGYFITHLSYRTLARNLFIEFIYKKREWLSVYCTQK